MPLLFLQNGKDLNGLFASATGLSHLPKEIPLEQLASGSPHVFDRSPSELKDTDKDCSSQDSLTPVYAVSITFAVGVTIAVILHTCLGKNLVCRAIYNIQKYLPQLLYFSS